MAYPLTPIAFLQVLSGENRSDVANSMGAEIQAIETALLHPASQTQAPIRMRGGGNQFEWGYGPSGRYSTLGSTGGKSFIGLGCEAGTVPGTFTTRTQPGIVLTTDLAGGLLIQVVPLTGVANQTPVTRLTVPKSGLPVFGLPMVVSLAAPAYSAPGNGVVAPILWSQINTDPWGIYKNDAAGNFQIPVNGNGVFAVIASVTWAGNPTSTRGLRINFPATTIYYDWRLCDPDGAPFSQQIVMLRWLNDGEVFAVGGAQFSGVTLAAPATFRMIKLS